MRNFEERMDAIRSRSKARIAQRRKQISAVCIPMVLCLVFTGVYFGTKSSRTPELGTETTISVTTLGGVVVTDSQSGQVLASADTHQALTSYISQLQVQAGRQDHGGAVYNAEEASSGVQNKTVYTITLTNDQGNTQIFTLSVGYLTDTSDDIVYKISSSQYKRLMELLGLTK